MHKLWIFYTLPDNGYARYSAFFESDFLCTHYWQGQNQLRLGRVNSMVCRTAMTVCGGGGERDPTQKKRPKRKKETQIPKKRPKHKKETQTHKRDSNSCKRPKVMKRRPKSSSWNTLIQGINTIINWPPPIHVSFENFGSLFKNLSLFFENWVSFKVWVSFEVWVSFRDWVSLLNSMSLLKFGSLLKSGSLLRPGPLYGTPCLFLEIWVSF